MIDVNKIAKNLYRRWKFSGYGYFNKYGSRVDFFGYDELMLDHAPVQGPNGEEYEPLKIVFKQYVESSSDVIFKYLNEEDSINYEQLQDMIIDKMYEFALEDCKKYNESKIKTFEKIIHS